MEKLFVRRSCEVWIETSQKIEKPFVCWAKNNICDCGTIYNAENLLPRRQGRGAVSSAVSHWVPVVFNFSWVLVFRLDRAEKKVGDGSHSRV